MNPAEPIALKLEQLQRHLKTNPTPRIDIFQSIDSDMAYLKREIAENPQAFPYITLTEDLRQIKTSKQKKSWYSQPYANIHLSLGYTFHQPIHALNGLSLIVGLSVITALIASDITQDLQVKWPNDVYGQAQKLCGILIQTEIQNPHLTHAIIGIGLNVNMIQDKESPIHQPWTSLRLLSGKIQDRNHIAAHLINALFTDLPVFQAHGTTPFLERWAQYDYLKGKTLTLKTPNETHVGVAAGIDLQGRLLLKNADGALLAFASGEIVKSW